MTKKTISTKTSAGLKTKKRKGLVQNAIVFQKPDLGFWASITNIVSFYITSIASISQNQNKRTININNALRTSNAFKKTIERFHEEIGTALHEQLNAFLMEATIIDTILSQYKKSKQELNKEDIQTLHAKLFKIQYILSSLQKSFKEFIKKEI